MADAQYVIDIAAQLPDGAATIAELEALSAQLAGAGSKSDGFQGALKRLSTEFDAAKAAADAANAALKQGGAEYALLEREAIRASKALEKAQLANVVPIDVYRRAQQANAALAGYEKQLHGLEGAAQQANREQARLGAGLDKVRRLGSAADQRAGRLNQQYEKMGQIVSFLPGPLGQMGSRLLLGAKASHELGGAMGASTARMLVTTIAVIGATVAVVALTVAMVAGAVAAAKYAIGQADAARSAELTREAFAALAPETAAAVDAFDAVKVATGQSDAELVSLAKSLRAAKVSAADMPEALRAAAMAEAALGKGGSAEFVQRIQAGELAVAEFAAEVDAKFGGVVAARMRGLDAQGKRFKALWAGLFDRLNVEPVLDAVGVLVGMFEKTSPLAQAMSDAVAGAFKIVEQYALPAAYAVEAFALGVAISFVKAYLAVKPFLGGLGDITGALPEITALGKLFGYSLLVVGAGLAALAVVGGVVLGVLGLAVGLFSAAAAAVFALGYALGTGLAWAIDTTIGLLSVVGEAIAGWYNGLFEMGGNILRGLADGVIAGVGWLVDAVSGAVGKAIDAAKSLLGIASPSKVFAEIGMNTALGFSEGVDDGAGEARGSLAAMVASDPTAITPPGAAASVAGAAGSSSSNTSTSSRSVNLAGATFNFSGVADAETARERFSQLLTELLEGDADSLTGAPA